MVSRRSLWKWTKIQGRSFCSGNNSEDDNSDPKKRNQVTPSLKQKYDVFTDNKSKPIYDYHEEMYGLRWDEKHMLKDMDPDEQEDQGFYLYREKKSHKRKAYDFSRKRGVTGVFDLEDLVDALKSEQLRDLTVIQIPSYANYCDHMILATAKNKRHLNSVVEFIRKLYKLKRNEDDPQLSYTVGEKGHSNWQVIDFGSIVLHLFLPGVRQQYDIETLWSVGPEYDDKTVHPEYGNEVDVLQKHVNFMESLLPHGP